MRVILLFGFLVTVAASQTVDYCHKELCKKNTVGGQYYYAKHIGCKNRGDFSSACPKQRSIVPMNSDLISLILHLHNDYRRKISVGGVRGYAKASQMIEMSWDPELAKLAELKTKTCIMAHDECRSTARFRKPGQNLGITKTTNKRYTDTIEIIRNHTAEWFIEYKKCDMSYIRSYRSSNKLIGHFTQMAMAGADRIGCAMSLFDDGRRNMFLACNYSLCNLVSKPIYVAGEPCSKCKSGCSKTYPGLCNTNEKDYWSEEEKEREISVS